MRCAPGERTFYRMKVPKSPGSGVHREVESEESWILRNAETSADVLQSFDESYFHKFPEEQKYFIEHLFNNLFFCRESGEIL